MKTGIVNVKRKIERARAGEYEGSERAREKERHARAVAAHAFHDGSVRGRVGFRLQRAELDPKQLVAEPSLSHTSPLPALLLLGGLLSLLAFSFRSSRALPLLSACSARRRSLSSDPPTDARTWRRRIKEVNAQQHHRNRHSTAA